LLPKMAPMVVPQLPEQDLLFKFPGKTIGVNFQCCDAVTGKENYAFVLPPQKDRHRGKLTVVLDIDETLVHTEVVDYLMPETANAFTLKVERSFLRVQKRPFLDEFLKEASRNYELIAYTAGSENYASPLLDKLDPTGTIFTHRLFRSHCPRSSTRG